MFLAVEPTVRQPDQQTAESSQSTQPHVSLKPDDVKDAHVLAVVDLEVRSVFVLDVAVNEE